MFVLLSLACTDYNIHTKKDALPPNERPPLDTGEYQEEEPVPGEPVAHAGQDVTVAPLEFVTLNGTESYDPEGKEPLKYDWTLISGPDGSTATLVDNKVAKPTMWLDLAGDYELELTVMNTDGVWDSTPDTVIVSAIPAENFFVQLSWNTETDLDLHLLDGSSALWSNPGDCNYCNMAPQWGAAGPDDNPSLDWDTIYEGYGPETITIDAPASGTYTAVVHYYGEFGDSSCWGTCPPATATVDVFIDGELKKSFTETLQDAGDTFEAAVIEVPSGTITAGAGLGKTNKISCDY